MNINAVELVANGNNPQKGALVGQTFKDPNLNTTVDHDAVSGCVMIPRMLHDYAISKY
jgi:hypothetical protein